MHQNREISNAPSFAEGRSAKAINHNADMHVLEKSDCASRFDSKTAQSSSLSQRHILSVFMLPWCIRAEKTHSFNADISGAVFPLLPKDTVNKERLTGDEVPKQLTEAIVSSIEIEWKLRGTEDMVGPALTGLRKRYEIVESEITPYHHPEYGTAHYKGEPEEVNLHPTLRKSSFPRNVADAWF